MKVSFLFRISVALLFLFFSTTALFAQSVAADSIWLKEQTWEKGGSVKKKMLAFEEFMKSFPEGEGEITYFVKGDSILKINEWSSTEQTIIIRDFYYTDTLLAAVHVREFTYPKSNGVPDHRHANKVSDYVVIFDLVKGTTRNKVVVASKKGYGSREEYIKSSGLYRMVYILAQ